MSSATLFLKSFIAQFLPILNVFRLCRLEPVSASVYVLVLRVVDPVLVSVILPACVGFIPLHISIITETHDNGTLKRSCVLRTIDIAVLDYLFIQRKLNFVLDFIRKFFLYFLRQEIYVNVSLHLTNPPTVFPSDVR